MGKEERRMGEGEGEGSQPNPRNNRQEEEDESSEDEFVGPGLDLFQNREEQPIESKAIQQNENQSIGNAAPSSTLLSSLPISHEIAFPPTSSHSRAITAIALDKHTATQMITGSSGDYTVKIWDMNSMNKQLRPKKEFQPFPGHPIRSLSFSPDQNASMFLCCCGNN